MSDVLPVDGLTSQEVTDRVSRGEVNVNANVKTRSIKDIMYSNIFTLFNAVNVILAICVFFTGSYKNMLFMLVIVLNAVIGIVQEIRSKMTTDKLSIIASSNVSVVRDGKIVEIPLDQIVRDDVIQLGRGSQIPSDSVVVSGSCRVDESLLTGESDLIPKEQGDELMSGSFINAGVVYARVIHVGSENYAAKISNEAKAHKAINSEIMKSLNGIIKTVSIIIFPLGALLFCREHFLSGTDWVPATLSTVSAMIGMIPEGLILLTSTALAVSVVRLAQSKVLVQQLYCIETLARVDVLCLDKTGTITTGAMEVASVEHLDGASPETLEEANAAYSAIAFADNDPNETSNAIRDYYRAFGINEKDAASSVSRYIPFSSDKKWSGAVLADGSAYVMGAAQFVLRDSFEQVRDQASRLAADARLILLARVDGFTEDGDAVGKPVPLAFLCIHDQIRSTAKQTIGYFKDEGVTVKVISGDDPKTVSGIAAKVGVEGAENYVDATTLTDDEKIADAISKYSVFGRVKPEQKKAFVLALQNQGHTVAMTGDGVNDTLALKASDCSVAMASGSDAARNVAQLVLVDNDFASMPKVVAEGRRCINNLQRSGSLFLVKTFLSMVLAILFLILPWQYPFQPIQMTLISAFTIGIPSFVLALEPNRDRIKGKFLENVVVKSIPGSITAICGVLAVNIIGHMFLGFSYEQISTVGVLVTAWVGMNLVVRLCVPFTPIRAALCVVMVAGTAVGSLCFSKLFSIAPFTTSMVIVFVACAACASIMFNLIFNAFGSWHAKRQAALV